jgi:dolichyl-phosphate beta-glucosyltransferase
MSASPVDLSVVIPAYNEASRLGDTLERVLAYLERRGAPFEVLVVDDGSADNTVEVAHEYGHRGVWVLELARNRGKGAALRHGVVASSGDKVLLCDADLSTPIQELERLEPRLREAHLVLGSRGVEDSRIGIHQPPHREMMGKLFNLLIRLLGFGSFRDTQCGFKLLRGAVARELFPALTIERFAYDVELVWEARRRGLRVVEVGVEWHNSPVSRVRPWHDAPQMFRDVLRIRFGRRRAPAARPDGRATAPARIPEAAARGESSPTEGPPVENRAEHTSHGAR